ncbi:right-handed parallel beta-helix repeat-containing protein [Tabrizicola sp. BL-A-41-H6]|uniref:right-handed parallel beta-helix repeat-containing protein n=1 Tax=Tabrizicola sp. BL-A-41-H6 TaxID=3421107 RepID=UPI003D677B6D
MADRRLALLCCIALGAPLPLRAEAMSFADRQRIEARVEALAESGGSPGAAGRIMTDLGLSLAQPDAAPPASAGFAREAGGVIEMVDIRLLLTQIAVQSGARDHQALVRAQGDREHDVILLRGGFLSLDELVDLAKGSAAQDFVTRSGDTVVLSRPLAIWSDAGLHLGADDRLTLDRPNGSFVANFGWLDLAGGSVTGSDASNPAEPGFRPFVMTAGQGRMTAVDASFQHLGFGDAPVFGGVSVVNTGLQVPKAVSFVATSRLEDVGTLAFVGTTGADVAANAISGASGTAILLSRAAESRIRANRIGPSAEGQGIRVSAGSRGVTLSGNRLSGLARTGIAIDQDSRDVTVAGNTITAGRTTGIALRQASCVTITGNLIALNDGSGVTLGDTGGISVSDNAVLFNEGSGFLVRDQDGDAAVGLTGNVLIGNAAGFRGATPGRPTIAGNNLDGQMPRVFAGDLSHLTVGWLQSRQGGAPVPVPATTPPCGALEGDG